MKTINFILLIIAGFAFTIACKVSKNITVPDVPAESQYRGAIATTDTLSSIGHVAWKEFFKDPVLLQLIDSAVARNNDLQLALKNIDAAKQTLKQSKWGNIPTVGLQASALSNRPSDNSLSGFQLNNFLGQKHVEDYNVSAVISWEADIWGKISNRKAEALASYLQTEEARKAVQTQLVAAVSDGYYNLLMLDEQLTIAKTNLKLNEKTLEIITLQYNSGQATSLAIQQSEAQKLQTQSLIPQFEQAIAIQENALSILVGKLPGDIYRQGKLADVVLLKDFSVGVPSGLLAFRPDVHFAELEVDKANAQVGYTKAAMYPSLSITAQGGINSFRASNWFNIPASLFGLISGNVVQPLLQHRELKTNYEIAKINREKSVIKFRQQFLNAVGEVSDQLVTLDKLHQQKTIVADRVNTLQKAISNADMLYKSGLANYLEVIIAQSNVLQSELELIKIKKEQLSSSVNLYRALGGGWN